MINPMPRPYRDWIVPCAFIGFIALNSIAFKVFIVTLTDTINIARKESHEDIKRGAIKLPTQQRNDPVLLLAPNPQGRDRARVYQSR